MSTQEQKQERPGISGKAALLDRARHNTQHHPPSSPEIVAAHEAIRAATETFMEALIMNSPVSREQSVALTKAEEAMMWANAAVARYQSTKG